MAHLDNPKTLRLLIEQNRALVAPVIVRPYHAWSNFWGALNKDGFYGRSHDYMDIVNAKRTGLWNVPFVNSVYLIKVVLDYWQPPKFTLCTVDGKKRGSDFHLFIFRDLF